MGVLLSILMQFLVKTFGTIFMHAAFKIAYTVLYISIVVAAIYAYVSTYRTLVNSISQTMPEIVNGVWGWVMPSNAHACFLVIFAVIILRFVTRQWLKLINAKFKAGISN